MAQQDQGIMALSGSPMGAAPEPQINMREFRKQAYPVAKDAVREVAPEALGEAQALMSSEIAAEMGDMSLQELNQLADIVDYINENPEEYPQVRASLISSGMIDEEDFPPEMDEEFFAVVQAVLEEAIMQKEQESATMAQGPVGMMPPQGFAKGGIAEAAQMMASMGRNGDTMLAHITPAEARLLKARGGSGTINPVTGLPEFFLKKAFKAVKKVAKKVVSSPIGRIVATVALTAVGVPAPIAAGLVTKAAGGSWKDALKAAAISYISAPTGPIGQYVTKVTPALNALNPAVAAGIRAGVTSTGASLLTGSNLKQALTAGVTAGLTYGVQAAVRGAPAAPGQQPAGQQPAVESDFAPQQSPVDPNAPIESDYSSLDGLEPAQAGAPVRVASLGDAGVSDAMATSAESLQGAPQISEANITPNYADMPTSAPFPEPTYPVSTAETPNPWVDAGAPEPSILDRAKSFFTDTGAGDNANVDVKTEPSIWEKTKEFMYPSDPTDAQIAAKAGEIKAEYADQGLKITDAAAIKSATEALTPGALAQYGPMTAAGLGIAALSGAFKEQPADAPEVEEVADEIRQGTDVPESLLEPIQNMPGMIYDKDGNIVGVEAWNPYAGINTATNPTEVATGSYLSGTSPTGGSSAEVPTGGLSSLFTAPGAAPSPFLPAPNLTAGAGTAGTSGVASQPPVAVGPDTVDPGAPQAPGEGLFEYADVTKTPQQLLIPGTPYQQQVQDPATLFYAQNPYGIDGQFGLLPGEEPTKTFRNGGIAAFAQGGYPRRIGQISGPGTETSDDIPAMLSDGEFVMTARAVRGAGNGSRRAGAKKMYALMHQLEQNAARG